MLRMCLSLLLGLLLAVLSAADDNPNVALPGVADLKPDNFDKIVTPAKHALVEFYAPWCGHCKRMTPEYKKLGALVSSDPALKNRVVIGKVDADAHRSLGERFGVTGFPTIKFFPRGKTEPIAYEGGRTAEAFLEYLKKKVNEDKGFARVDELDVLAKKFVEAADKATLLEEAAGVAKALDSKHASSAELYLHFMKKASEKGAEYLTTEKARLERMLASGGLNAAKADEISRKVSVLGAFADDEQ